MGSLSSGVDAEFVISFLTQRCSHILDRLKELEEETRDAERLLSCIEAVIDDISPMVPNEVYGVASEVLKAKGFSLESALEFLAMRNQGHIDSTEVRPVLSAASLLPHDRANASQYLYDALKNIGSFEKIGRGKYRLRQLPALPASS